METNREARILVIDDSTTNVVLLDAVLTKEGYRVETALNASEGLKTIRKNKPDLIFLDILMPVSNGFEFIKELKNDSSTCDIPVIIVSAIGNEENRKKANDLGAVDFIPKPVDIQSLLQLVQKHLS